MIKMIRKILQFILGLFGRRPTAAVVVVAPPLSPNNDSIRYYSITGDGEFLIYPARIARPESVIYIKGDNPNGSFEIGTVNPDGTFALATGNAVVNDNTVIFHDINVYLAVRVNGYAGTETFIGITRQ